MDGSPSAVLTLGLGSWGSSGLLLTLGLGVGEAQIVRLTARKLHHLRSPNPLWHTLTTNPPTYALHSNPSHVIELPE